MANDASAPLEHMGKIGKRSKSLLLSVLTGSIMSLRKENAKHVIADARQTTVLQLSQEAPFSSCTWPWPKHSFWTDFSIPGFRPKVNSPLCGNFE